MLRVEPVSPSTPLPCLRPLLYRACCRSVTMAPTRLRFPIRSAIAIDTAVVAALTVQSRAGLSAIHRTSDLLHARRATGRTTLNSRRKNCSAARLVYNVGKTTGHAAAARISGFSLSRRDGRRRARASRHREHGDYGHSANHVCSPVQRRGSAPTQTGQRYADFKLQTSNFEMRTHVSGGDQ